MEIMWVGIFLVIGWIWAYFFVRQILFDYKIAYPTVKKMHEADKELISINANRYTTVSVILCSFFILLGAVLIIVFFRNKLYILIPFFAGFIISAIMIAGSIKLSNRKLFDSFCATYYRFIPDDELRTAMYNCKTSKMKLRLHDMNLPIDFIPVFDKED